MAPRKSEAVVIANYLKFIEFIKETTLKSKPVAVHSHNDTAPFKVKHQAMSALVQLKYVDAKRSEGKGRSILYSWNKGHAPITEKDAIRVMEKAKEIVSNYAHKLKQKGLSKSVVQPKGNTQSIQKPAKPKSTLSPVQTKLSNSAFNLNHLERLGEWPVQGICDVQLDLGNGDGILLEGIIKIKFTVEESSVTVDLMGEGTDNIVHTLAKFKFRAVCLKFSNRGPDGAKTKSLHITVERN